MKPANRSRATFLFCVSLAVAGCTVGESGPPEQSDPDDEINERLGLYDSVRIVPRVEIAESGALRVELPIDGTVRELVLDPVDIRKSGFKLFVQGEDGEITQVAAPPSTTVRGVVSGAPGSVVTGSLMEDGLHARIDLGDTAAGNTVYWTEPVARVSDGGGEGEYVLYTDADVVKSPEACGLEHAEQGEITDNNSIEPILAAQDGLAIAELAVDADYEFFQAWGSVENAVARMETVIAGLNVQYERDAGISHVITSAIVRTTPDDPYTTTDPLAMLQNELRSHWLNNHGDIERDAVHLFTGKNLDGSTIGIAYVGVMCGSFGFGLSQSNFSSNLSYVTDLTAHELGHNWDAGHCNCSSYTMNAFLVGANRFNPTLTVPSIEEHRDTRSCVSFGDACPEDPDKTEPGQCGCGVADVDADLDGVADCVDGCPSDPDKTEPGQCGCDVPDVHSDGDGVADCNDDCPMDGTKTEPGQCGCGVADTDTDGDGVADCNDGCPEDPTATTAADCPDPPTCGDDTCDVGESPCNCPADCGSPPATELSCADGVDDDCDTLVDCSDPDCDGNAICDPVCVADGASCAGDADCCSSKCRGPNGRKTCHESRDGGGGGGSKKCGQPGDPCGGGGSCCSRECLKSGGGSTGVCIEPPEGALSSTDGSGDDSEGETYSSVPKEGAPVTGGCSTSGSTSGGMVWLVGVALALMRRRRDREVLE